MRYTTINIQGNLISEEILHKIESGEAAGQSAEHFGFEKGTNLRGEIEYAWSRIKLDWKHFSEKMENLASSDPYGTALSRRWMESFFDSFGFELTKQKSSLQGTNNQSYNISYTAHNLDHVPIHIVGFREPGKEKNTLDIRTSGGTTRISPHGTLQEYLNVTEYLFGIVTNGLLLRLVRDSGRLIRLTYAEFDLKRMLDEDKYSEFTVLYRILHASRFPQRKDLNDQCYLEKYYQDSIESGNRIRSGLSKAVQESLQSLGNGLLSHPDNNRLREKILNRTLSAEDFNHQLLRLIYRLLFLMVTEERDLIFSDANKNEDEDLLPKYKDIYYNYYSLQKLRKLSESTFLHESIYSDLWKGLVYTFRLFETGGNGHKMGIKALGSDLFSPDAIPDITSNSLDNKILLKCIRNLSEFEDEKKQRSRINYRGLDVEELGSVYEGLLELGPIFLIDGPAFEFMYIKSYERSSSGSHYTPEDLVKPLIQHSLEYLIEDRVTPFLKGKISSDDAVKSLLSLNVCDVACGSGHILLSAARRIAHEIAKIRTGEQQPNPVAFREALKETIRSCIYGVDKNPLAVELCKVALWLESHNPEEPLSFLDHHIKCGDAIVGLAHYEELENGIPDEAFKALPGDDKIITKAFRERNIQERKTKNQSVWGLDEKMDEELTFIMNKYSLFNSLPERTPEEVAIKAKAHSKFEFDSHRIRLKQLADGIVAQFFIPKINSNKQYILTDAEYRTYLRQSNKLLGTLQSQKLSFSNVIAVERRFFHWFIEFPDIFNKGGFDCVLGNPPFLGDKKLKNAFGESFLEYCRFYFYPAGITDLIVYFLRRIYDLINNNSFLSIIATNTISQGDAKDGGLDFIVAQNGDINFAINSTKWPGKAEVIVSLLAIYKGKFDKQKYLGQFTVNSISTLLREGDSNENAFILIMNQQMSFIGNYVLGLGFVLENDEARALINKDPKYGKCIFPYLNGDNLNSSPLQKANRWVINFNNISEYDAIEIFPDCYKIVEERVKPERLIKSDKSSREKWWLHARNRPNLYQTIRENHQVLVTAQVSKTVAFSFVKTKQVYDSKLIVFSFEDYFHFGILQSNLHYNWAWKYCTTMKNDLSYTPEKIFETFPFPQNLINEQKMQLETIGRTYHEERKQLMVNIQLGLTKTYNLFHCEAISLHSSDEIDKHVYGLKKHLQKTPDTISFGNTIQGILNQRELHVQMDKAVLGVYGWQDIQLRHDFYEVDYLPENDRVRYTIHPDARKEVLKRLLELNHKIHDEEVKAGLWDKKKAGAAKRTSKKLGKRAKGNSGGQGDLFE